MVLYSYSIGFVYILIGEMVTGTFTPAFTYFNEHPKAWLWILNHDLVCDHFNHQHEKITLNSVFIIIFIFICWLFGNIICPFDGENIWCFTRRNRHNISKGTFNYYVFYFLHKTIYTSICMVWPTSFTWYLIKYI